MDNVADLFKNPPRKPNPDPSHIVRMMIRNAYEFAEKMRRARERRSYQPQVQHVDPFR